MSKKIHKFRVWSFIKDDDGCEGFLESSGDGLDFFFDGGWRGISYFLHKKGFDVQEFIHIPIGDFYEGDIVDYDINRIEYDENGIPTEERIAYSKRAVITFSTPNGTYVLDSIDQQDNYAPFLVNYHITSIQVIGNIYENKELLKYDLTE